MKSREHFKPEKIKGDLELKAFIQFRQTGRISLRYRIALAFYALATDIPFALLKYWPGPVGIQLRQYYYRWRLAEMGKNVIIESGVDITRPRNVSISDYAFIDKHVVLNALSGRIVIGRRIHIATHAILSGTTDIRLGDYAAIGAFSQIYSHTEAPVDGKRMSGPMIPESMKGMITAPVSIGKDAVVGAGAIVLPGANIGEGAVVGANSLITAGMNIPPYAIFLGIPARLAGMREKVTVPDI